MERKYIDIEEMETMEEALGYDRVVRTYYYFLNRPQVNVVLRLIRNRKNISILDIGTGTARIPIAIAKRRSDCKIFAIDLSANMLQVASRNIKEKKLKNNITLQQIDAKNLDFKDDSFDIVICSNMLHHLEDPTRALNEIKRVVKKDGGIIVINDSIRPPNEFILNLLVTICGMTQSKVMRKSYRESLYSSFSINELEKMLTSVGITGFTEHISFPDLVTFVKA